MRPKTVWILAGAILLYFLLTKKNSGSPISSHPSVATVDYGAFGLPDADMNVG